MSTTDPERFIPALRFPWLTRLYDPIVRYTTREATFRRLIVERAKLVNGLRVLDVGSGTGSLASLALQTSPDTEVIGVEIDMDALGIAAAKTGSGTRFVRASATRLPFESATFDRVFVTLVLHHLTDDAKSSALAEIRRVLRPGGSLHLADWQRGTNLLLRTVFVGVRVLDGMETTRRHANSSVADIVAEGGFCDVDEYRTLATPFGSIGLVSATI